MELLLNHWGELWTEWHNNFNQYQERLENLSELLGIEFTPQTPWYLGGDWLSDNDDKIFISGLNPATPGGHQNINWHTWQAEQTQGNNYDEYLEFNRNCLNLAFEARNSHSYYTHLAQIAYAYRNIQQVPTGYQRYQVLHNTVIFGEFFPFCSPTTNANLNNLNAEALNVFKNYWTILKDFIEHSPTKYFILMINQFIKNDLLRNHLQIHIQDPISVQINARKQMNVYYLDIGKKKGLLTPFIGGRHTSMNFQGAINLVNVLIH